MGYFGIITLFFFHPSAPSLCPAPQKFHGSQNVLFFLPFFVLPVILFFYKHNMYRNSTQTNMFLNYFFHIQIQFLWVLNSPHEPATYIHNEFFFVFFGVFLLSNYSNHPFEVQVLAVFTHKAHTIWAGSFGACMHSSCARASHMPACVPVGVM